VFCHAIAAKGLLAVIISTIERRFGLSSSQTAWMAATYEIAGVPALLIIGYLGSTLRRPVWIGAGLITIGVGLGIYSIPHFAAPPYRYAASGDSNNLCVDTASHLSSNASNSLANDRYDMLLYCAIYRVAQKWHFAGPCKSPLAKMSPKPKSQASSRVSSRASMMLTRGIDDDDDDELCCTYNTEQFFTHILQTNITAQRTFVSWSMGKTAIGSQDFSRGALFFVKKVDDFLVVALKRRIYLQILPAQQKMS